MFYCFHELYENFDDMDTMTKSVIFQPVFLRYFTYVFHFIERFVCVRVCVRASCVCVRVCILMCDFELCMHVFIVGQ